MATDEFAEESVYYRLTTNYTVVIDEYLIQLK